MKCTSANSCCKPPYNRCNMYQTAIYSVHRPRKLTIIICEILRKSDCYIASVLQRKIKTRDAEASNTGQRVMAIFYPPILL